METRSKTLCKKRDLRGSSTASSSNRLRKKRFTAAKSTPKEDLHVYDESYLEILKQVRTGVEVSMGCSDDTDFWQQVATKLSRTHSLCFTLTICLNRIKQHRSIYRNYQHRMHLVHHSVMNNDRYRELLIALFKQESPIKIPQLNRPSSSRGTSIASNSGVRAIDGASSMVYPGELATVLTDLHSFHGLTFDKIMKISPFFSQPSNSLLVEIFFSMVLPEKKIEFIGDIINHHHL